MEKNTKIKGGSFKTMGLDYRLLRNILYENPTPIQRKTIPLVLERRSLMGVGRTGSGKTLCYLIPAVQRAIEGERTLVIAPTKELVTQVRRVLKRLARGIEDVWKLIEINTPGNIQSTSVEMLVVDEIDRILEEPSLKLVFDRISEEVACQKVFFSATLPDHPLNIKVVEIEAKINETVKHFFFYVPSESKEAALLRVLDKTRKTIVFVATKYAVELLLEILNKNNFESRGIYSSMDDEARRTNFKDFNSSKFNILVVTDVAARGLDIPYLDTVVNYDLCDERTFLHRVGRVRGMGVQYSFVTYTDVFHFFNIQETYLPNVEIGTIPQEYLDVYDFGEFEHLKSVANKGHQKCLEFRRKVSVPAEYKDKIKGFKTHSMFEHKETLLDQLKEMESRKTLPRKEDEKVENKEYRDQTFIPYARKDSRIHSSAFGVAKDDYVRERKEKFSFSMMRRRTAKKTAETSKK
ncbi:DEAD box ATP-dependent RNA helicase [Encephalitozoon intestinalis ATCC 50506]|uniref:RNA helicase n=1 Tax=Encephalitozoon intestinalis (strain ATCC 50506) TaxID=876142 RepID=E0S7P7_ENCIT|nr:DEAD box ATP-dependent RNA helicase [Encephalitozoon intestinalis ATCC 50506]ADM11726.1 DEAD box ATP-dependent RNA helicase [Encephalitozoon intestinalis ATCC 50506]UTX45465.1 DEAD box RNA helicase [Encephalitozoon intestinalis]